MVNGRRGPSKTRSLSLSHPSYIPSLLSQLFHHDDVIIEGACVFVIGSHSIVKQSNTEYDLKRQELFEHYYPLEISPDIPLCKKFKLMEEW